MKSYTLLISLSLFATVATSRTVVLENDDVQRRFKLQDDVWVTESLRGPVGTLELESDEFRCVAFGGESWSARDFLAEPSAEVVKQADGVRSVSFTYARRSDRTYSTNAPVRVVVRHTVRPGEPYLRKAIELEMLPHASLDRLEVERFVTRAPARWGGRGQPVYLGDHWFVGLEHPAGHSRHTDGQTPAADTHHFEKVGNYSLIDLEGADREPDPKPGLTRLFHFPGYAREEGGRWIIRSQRAVAGTGDPSHGMELLFMDYLNTIRKKPRSFTHYNNWFDPAGKSLKGENFVNVWKAFQSVVTPAGVHVDSMVPDNGWQNGASIWQPSAGHFPGGMADLKRLGSRLKEEGTQLGLWLSLDSTTCNIGWGEKNGYERARPNAYFSRYFAHYCLAGPRYKADLAQQLEALIRDGQLNYFKHDFNHLTCIADGHGHAPTDRHGHEANVDAMIELLALCLEANPDLFQNLTNWIWYSPWWLMHGDALWFLAGDDGVNGNTPELSTRAMATTDRDVYVWRQWGRPDDRPLVPISHLMTHGFVRNPGRMMESPQDTLADWADHVWMYYGRGVQMKEWYLTPSAMTAEHWAPVLAAHRWSASNFNALVHTVFVGGRPDEGHAYGYIGWDGDRGVLVARNPSVKEQELVVPCDASTWYRGATGRSLRAKVVYPYRDGWSAEYRSGQDMVFKLPGYATLAFEIEPGRPLPSAASPAIGAVGVDATPKQVEIRWTVPTGVAERVDLLLIGHPELPDVRIEGHNVAPSRSSRSALNQFAGYARDGMPSTNVSAWRMSGYDLRSHAGRTVTIQCLPPAGSEGVTFEAWRLVDQAAIGGEGMRRSTDCVTPRTTLQAIPVLRRPLTDEERSSARSAVLRIEAFGVNGGEFGSKEVLLNGDVVGALPVSGDEWVRASIPVPLRLIKPSNELVVRHNGREDKFKFRGADLRVELADGALAGTAIQREAQTSFGEWAHGEGALFPTATSSVPVRLDF